MRRAGFIVGALALLWSGAAAAHPGSSRAIAAISAEIERSPSDARLRLERAALHRRAGDLQAAMADLRVVEHVAPEARRLRLERALVRKALGNAAGALSDLDRFLASGPATAAALCARAELLEARGDAARARADYDAAIRLGATPELVLARGRIDESRGDLERAASGYEEGLRLLGGALTVRLALVRVERARSRWGRAAALVSELIEASAARADWLLLRAEIHDQAKQPARARSDRRRALAELDAAIAKRPTALKRLSRAKAYLALGRRAAAIAELERVVEQAPKLTEARALLASAKQHRKGSTR